ncbi:WcaI family glycosyltransferase [Parerythrobacter aurantius]|uniref:WcaI family glycosyltransferase n=1 Tax=Parerythrobacter aurantius TaxID=3127706 RepID=UPI0032557EB5
MASIWLVGLNYAPEPIGIGPYTAGWAEALAARGHRVGVVCGVPYYPQWRRYDDYPQSFRLSHESGVEVLRVPHHVPPNPGTVSRLLHYASFAANARRGLAPLARHAGGRPDLVIAIAPSLLAAPVALRLARRSGAVSWLHIQDFEVEAALATGLLPGAATRLGLRFERAVLRRFDRVSTIGPAMLAKAGQKRGHGDGLMELRNWAEPGVGAEAAEGSAMRRSLGLPEGTLALYSGNLARKQGIGIILEAARALEGRRDIHLAVVGEGPAAGEVRAAAAASSNLHWRPLQPRERLPELLAMADMHLLPQLADAADLVLPSKLANMLASGRPVIATADEGTSLALEMEGCGIRTPAGDAASLAQAVVGLAEDGPRRKALGQAARGRADERWSREAILRNFVDSVEATLAGSPR